MNDKKVKKAIINGGGTVIGSAIMAVGIASFLLPNQLSSGGFSGVATITYYLLKIPMGVMIMVLNIPLFLFAGYRLGREFFIKSLIGTVSLLIFIDILDRYPPITTDRFLACIYGGAIIGIGTAIILKVDSSTGGTELIAHIIKTYNPYISMSKYLTMIDIIIITLNVIFFKHIEIGLYSAIAIYLYGQLIDIFFEGVYYTNYYLLFLKKMMKLLKQ
ncbi:MAG: YitT family protein [Clostridia bacterium]